jgi:hypothetical protein
MCKLPCCEIMNLIYLWVCGASHTVMLAACGHSSATICAFMKYINQLVASMITDESCQIGGEGITVEIDESKISKRKYERGHHVEGAWIVGGVERSPDRKLFVVRVPDRTQAALSTIIAKYVRPGSTILTDGWRSYAYLSQEVQYTHMSVNHSLNFKDPSTGTHTNTIEGTWAGIRSRIPKRNRSGDNIDDHLLAFIWRRQNEGRLWDAMLQAIRDTDFQS